MSVTATLIAKDEGHRIARCLESIRWVDEIVVVLDDRTSDDTAAVVERFGGRVLMRRFKGFSDQRQWADEQATGDWILSLDCDEVVPERLTEEIRAELAAPRFDAYNVPHLDYMFGRWIRHGGWFPQYHTRLYRRGVANWERSIHEKVSVAGRIGTLANPILHFSHGRVENWVNKMAQYTTVEARAMYDAGTGMSVPRILFEPVLYAGYKYFVKQGWRDGMHGLTLSLLLGTYRLVRNLKLWDLRQSARGPVESETAAPPITGPKS